jgi:SAM-dependent methyltransferase
MDEGRESRATHEEWLEKAALAGWVLPVQVLPRDIPHLHRLLVRSLPRNSTLRLLEVGAAPGRFMAYFGKHFGYAVAGIEFTSQGYNTTVENMRRLALPAEVIHADFFVHQFEAASFDVVFSAGFIEHFARREEVLRRMDWLLKPRGWLVATWPNLYGLNGWISRRLHPRVWKQHYQFRPSTVVDLLGEMGYEVNYVGPLDGPHIINPFAEVRFMTRRPLLSRLLRAPLGLFNRASHRLNMLIGFMPETFLLSGFVGVLARKPIY